MKKWNLRIVADDKRYEYHQTEMTWTLSDILKYADQEQQKLTAEGKHVTKVMLRFE
jgi:hypothetical protein